LLVVVLVVEMGMVLMVDVGMVLMVDVGMVVDMGMVGESLGQKGCSPTYRI